MEPEPEVREPAAKETATNETVNSSSPKEDKRPELPLTICLETKGGVATPLIYRGTQLPTEESQIFSTAEDNQKAVTVILVWGERANAEDNLALGRFNLEDIPPAKSGIPQIEVSTNVDTNLIMTVTAKDKGSGRIEILDAIDLSRVEIPEDMQKEALEEPRRKESHRDVGDIFEAFGSIFGASQAKTSKRKNTRAPKANEETCSRWGGKGRIIQSAGIFRLETTCPQCGGEGVVPRTSDWDRKGTGKGDDRKR
ncbi:MAG: Hsp70 family protein [Planctomycetes bacterium]|nr:Hsp70 family protein [Planctomycetota bacterium]